MMTFLEIRWRLIFDFELAKNSVSFIMEGLGYTLFISLASFLFALIGGLILALWRLSKHRLLQNFAKIYISFFRGVPIIVTLFFLYFGLPIVKVYLEAIHAALIGFSMTGSAYTAEIIRAAIQGVDDGQWEAAQSLGFTNRQTLRKIILPQAMRLAIPPLSNVIVDMVKSSSVAAMITVPEIFQKAKIIGGAEHDYMTMYILVAIIYWSICSLLSLVQEKLEQHFSQFVEDKRKF